MTKPIYFSGLNGIRAICAIAVVVFHVSLDLNRWGLNPYLFGKFDDGNPMGIHLGRYAVTIFFVLSGFLITFLLQEEKHKEKIDIKKFYFRRILRIWPLYYTYFIIALIVIFIYNIKTDYSLLPYYIFLSANIPAAAKMGIQLLPHYWSLGVEEQFYLFWPIINKKVDNLLILSIGTITFIITLKLTLHLLYPNTFLESLIGTSQFQCMLIGAVGALLLRKNYAPFLFLADNKVTQAFCWIIMLLVCFNQYHVASVLDYETIAVVALLIIIGQVKISNRIINLEHPLFQYLGKISFGIYIIHVVVIFFLSKYLDVTSVPKPLNYIIVFSLPLLITIFLADISYRYFESYFLKLKNKFVVIESSSTQNQ